MIVSVGLSHKTAPIEIRERAAVAQAELGPLLARIVAHPTLTEAVVLSTCNRVELVAAPRTGVDPADATRALTEILVTHARDPRVEKHLVARRGRDATAHLFRIAASLDSVVVGEPQILGQVKDAFLAAQEAHAVGSVLSRVFSRALSAAKRVRTETSIGEGLVSVPSVAVDLALRIYADLAKKTALLIGAGEMAEAAAEAFVKKGARLVVVNRSLHRAEELARIHEGSARPWDDLEAALAAADVVVAGTAARELIVPRSMVQRVMRARRGQTLFFIDIAVPRNVDPGIDDLDNVFRYEVDDLEGIVKESMQSRGAEARLAEEILAEETRKLEAREEGRGVVPTVVALRQRTKAVLEAELTRSLGGKLRHLPEADRRALAQMLDAQVNKLLHAPVTRLKRVAQEPRGEHLAEVVRELFELPEVTLIEDTGEQPGDDGKTERGA